MLVEFRAAKQAPKGAFTVEEHPNEGYEEQCIANVGDWYSPGIDGHRQIAAMPVFIEAALVESDTIFLVDVVHGHVNVCGVVVGRDNKM